MTKVSLTDNIYLVGIGIISPLILFIDIQLVFYFCFFYCILEIKYQKEFKIKEILNCASSFIKIIPIIYILSVVSKFALPEYEEQSKVIELKSNFSKDLAQNIIKIVFIAPVIEETIFRAFFYRSFKHMLPVSFSIIITSLTFATIHQNVLSFVLLFFLSGYLTYIYERFGSIIYPIMMHCFFNSIMLILIFLESYV